MAASISSSPGRGVFPRRAAACMICPAWQKPHWETSSEIQASFRPGAARPSIVVTRPAPTAETGVWQERTGSPPTWTVHDPQIPCPQPYLVPVRFSRSRSTQSRGMSSGASTACVLPLTVRL
jgi:hypothetical protein